ncbi:MAG: hypothetical protein JW940_35585 [Polyangiaceae bacterium]|nr:hypothetical protein [Polyangiaceae bacterium]
MRQLRLVLEKDGALVTLLLAAVLPLGTACGGKERSASASGEAGSSNAGTGGTAAGGAAAGGGRSSGGGPGTGGTTAAGGAQDTSWSEDTTTTDVPERYGYDTATVPAQDCAFAEGTDTIVPLPPEGTRAAPEQLCVDVSTSPDPSGWAARVTLEKTTAEPTQARGTITIAPALADLVMAAPEVRVVDLDDDLRTPTIGAVTRSGDVYVFDLVWPEAPRGYGAGVPPRLVLETIFEIECDGERQPVRALTALYFCTNDMEGSAWASSGDHCIQCAAVCEMVASPILPARTDDSVALGGALRLGLCVIGKVHGALVLLAEHDGGTNGIEYQWRASGGKLAWVERDVALWLPPEEGGSRSELLQVAVTSPHAAAVASLRWSAFG